MNFDLSFYKFYCCKMPLCELVARITEFEKIENSTPQVSSLVSLFTQSGKYRCIYVSPEHELKNKLYFESLKKSDTGSYSQKLHSPSRTCPFNINLINRFFLHDLQYSPKTHIKIFFSPKMTPDHTMFLVTGTGPWEVWLAKANPDLETLRLRFITSDKNEDAIRELKLYHGKKLTRIVRVMKDPKWCIWVDGEPQAFEEGKTYEKIRGKPIREYFTFADMVRFATNWGCPFDRDEFWASDQPMYCLGRLENDEDLADWQEWPDGFQV